MVNLQELRIGNFVINLKTNKIIEVVAISDLNFIEYVDSGNRITISNVEADPLPLEDDIIKQLIGVEVLATDHHNKSVFFFPGSSTTYALVYDGSRREYYIGISSTDKIADYSRITRTFFEYHKLQNAYYAVYNKELKKIN